MSTESPYHLPICCKFKKISLKSDLIILYTFCNDFIHAYSPRAGADTHWRQKFDVNRKALSFCPFVATLKNSRLKSDFIHIYSWFYTCI